MHHYGDGPWQASGRKLPNDGFAEEFVSPIGPLPLPPVRTTAPLPCVFRCAFVPAKPVPFLAAMQVPPLPQTAAGQPPTAGAAAAAAAAEPPKGQAAEFAVAAAAVVKVLSEAEVTVLAKKLSKKLRQIGELSASVEAVTTPPLPFAVCLPPAFVTKTLPFLADFQGEGLSEAQQAKLDTKAAVEDELARLLAPPEPEPEPEPGTMAETEAVAEAGSGPEVVAEAGAGAEPKAEAEAEPEVTPEEMDAMLETCFLQVRPCLSPPFPP